MKNKQSKRLLAMAMALTFALSCKQCGKKGYTHIIDVVETSNIIKTVANGKMGASADGVTHKEDKDSVVQNIRKLIGDGVYQEELYSDFA